MVFEIANTTTPGGLSGLLALDCLRVTSLTGGKTRSEGGAETTNQVATTSTDEKDTNRSLAPLTLPSASGSQSNQLALNLQYARPGLVPLPEAPVARALHLVQYANIHLDGGLHRCKEWTSVRDAYFNAGALFQSENMHHDAALAFNHSASVSRIFGSDLEVATAASCAVDSYALVDPAECRPLYIELIDIYRRNNRIGLVAKFEHDLAKNSELLGMPDQALDHYLLAAEAYSQSVTHKKVKERFHPEQKLCKERAAALYAVLDRQLEAAALFEELAKIVLGRGIAPTLYYFKAMLCRLVASRGEKFASGLAKAKVVFGDYQDLDPHFQKGVEYQLIKSTFIAFDAPSLAALDECWEKYRAYRPAQDEWLDMQQSRIRDNLFQYLKPFM